MNQLAKDTFLDGDVKIGGYKNVAKDTFLDGDVKNWWI